MMKLLIEHGADVRGIKDFNGMTPEVKALIEEVQEDKL